MAGNKWRKLSSAALNLFRVGMDLMSGGTALYRAEAVDEKEWHLIMVLMLLMNTNNVFFNLLKSIYYSAFEINHELKQVLLPAICIHLNKI